MFDPGLLLAFVGAVVVLVLIPGPNTLIILAHSIGGGRPAGLATVAGVETGTLVHTAAAALGLSAILSASAFAFTALKLAGIAYLIVAGIRTFLQDPPDLSPVSRPQLAALIAFRRAFLTNVLNPKVALFFLAFLPQFVQPENGHLVVQFLVLGLIVATVGFCFGCALAIACGSLAPWLRSHSTFARWQQRITGSVLIGLGVRLALTPVR